MRDARDGVRIASWNMKWFPVGYPVLEEKDRKPEREGKRIAHAASFIAWQQADVVLLEEMRDLVEGAAFAAGPVRKSVTRRGKRPVTTQREAWGMRTETFLRLCSRAPSTMMLGVVMPRKIPRSAPFAKPRRRRGSPGRPCGSPEAFLA